MGIRVTVGVALVEVLTVRVNLIIPPSGFLLDERVFPSLGVLKVAAVLEDFVDQAGHEVSVTDLSGRDWTDWEHVEADVYGITATMPQMPSAANIARELRAWKPEARLILGGPHVTLLHASRRQELARREVGRATLAFRELEQLFDVLVVGDGERAVFHALESDATPIIDADDPKSALFLTHDDLDTTPLAARHLIDIRSYRYEIDGLPTMSMIAQLGCPFGCAFCGGRRSPFLRRVRMRSTEAVIAEMRHLYETYGTRGFMFLDDELNVNTEFPNLLMAMMFLQGELGVAFRLRGLVKSELVTEVMARQMYAAGFRQLLIGFESGDERMLLNMQKHATRDQNTRCVDLLHQAGIRVKALMSLGHPGESPQSIQATTDWLLQVQPEDFDATIITVYPGTPYYDDAKPVSPTQWTYTAKNGDALHQLPVDHLKDVNFYKGSPKGYQSFVWTDHLSTDDLVAARDALEADVRARLKIPYPVSAAARQFEHSMGCR